MKNASEILAILAENLVTQVEEDARNLQESDDRMEGMPFMTSAMILGGLVKALTDTSNQLDADEINNGPRPGQDIYPAPQQTTDRRILRAKKLEDAAEGVIIAGGAGWLDRSTILRQKAIALREEAAVPPPVYSYDPGRTKKDPSRSLEEPAETAPTRGQDGLQLPPHYPLTPDAELPGMLEALAFDCEHTDGWGEVVQDLRAAADLIRRQDVIIRGLNTQVKPKSHHDSAYYGGNTIFMGP